MKQKISNNEKLIVTYPWVPRPPDRKMDPDGRLYHTGVRTPSPPQPNPVPHASPLFSSFIPCHPRLNLASTYFRCRCCISYAHLYQPTLVGVIPMLLILHPASSLYCIALSMLPAWRSLHILVLHTSPLRRCIHYQRYWQIWNFASYLCSYLPSSTPNPLVCTP